MSATILNMRRSSPGRIKCSACGATTDAACNCGAPYVAAKENAKERKRLAQEMYTDGLTQQQIANQLGVSQPTIVSDLKDFSLSENDKPPRPSGGRPKGSIKAQDDQSEPEQSVAEDFPSPAEADKGIILIAELVNNGLLLPEPRILDRLKAAMARADAEYVEAIKKAAYTLSELVRGLK